MNDEQKESSYLFGGNAPYVEELYEKFLQDSSSVDEKWRRFFLRMQDTPASDGNISTHDVAHTPIINALAHHRPRRGVGVINEGELNIARKQVAVQSLISAFRFLGSRRANLDPLHRKEPPKIVELEPSFYGLTEEDMSVTFSTANTFFGPERMTLREILEALHQTYCGNIGLEFMYISDPNQRQWWEQKFESIRSTPNCSPDKKKEILGKLTAAEGLERYLHTKYVGQKRFSLEGGESFIVSMNEVVEHGAADGIDEIVIGMAHRGRLNVLVNILGKSPTDLFAEFENKYSATDLAAGDVKYHNGFSSDVVTASGPMHLALAFNPSHLEIVDPVVMGSVRARQDKANDPHGKKIMGVLVHGDAAFAGQGIVMETLNLADTRGYGTGGTMHIVINNQIGFTTSDPRDKGSMTYCTDPAKLIEAPVIHVNGDDPESVVLATNIAMEFRDTFKQDVFVDIVCFRRLGHNEQDTPSLTQPLMYRKIGAHPGTRAVYASKLVSQGVLTEDGVNQMVADYKEQLQSGKIQEFAPTVPKFSRSHRNWTQYDGNWRARIHTAVPIQELKRLTEIITTEPPDFDIHPLLGKVINDRRAMMKGEMKVDWGLAEHLAFATLLVGGYSVRISGEDSGRGTFMHRHAVWHDQRRGKWDTGTWIPLEHLSPKQARFTVLDSVLSENAVLGFEYGYAAASPDTLTIWEAQFGDFANGAQVVIDQFISSGEAKWGRKSGLTLLLPHGQEGQGPEHSSARVERYLQLAADDNMLIVQPTTAAQIFHVLRRQLVGKLRKPLIVFSPKSLLRNKAAACDMEELANGEFQEIIGELDKGIDPQAVTRMICCSGKIYYEIVKRRAEIKASNVAVIRVEQLYPFAQNELDKQVDLYPNLKEVLWVQDEPQNQGAWNYIDQRIMASLPKGCKLAYAGRPSSSSPAVGYPSKHQEQLQTLLTDAFGSLKGFIQTR